MKNRKSDLHLTHGVLSFYVLLFLASARGGGSESTGQTTLDKPATAITVPSEITVPLKEIPVWEVTNERIRASFLRGQYAYVRALSKGEVLPGKRPEFTSDAPLYGQESFPNVVAGSGRSSPFSFALDCSQKGGDYDLLYFDEDRDEDLTNDKLRKPSRELDSLIRRSSSVKEVYFEPVRLTFDFGLAAGGRSNCCRVCGRTETASRNSVSSPPTSMRANSRSEAYRIRQSSAMST